MPYLKNTVTGRILGPMTADSAEFNELQSQRQGGKANRPLWEQAGQQEVNNAAPEQTIVASIPASAAGADSNTVVGLAPSDVSAVTAVEYYPASAVNGADTNSRTLSATNHTQSDHPLASKALTNGVNLTADENALTLNGTPSNLAVAAGDEIHFISTHIGTGIADPGGIAVVVFG